MRSKKFLRLPLLLLSVSAVVMAPAYAIDVPRDLRGTEIRQNTIKWEWAPVSGAVKYQVTVDGSDVGSTTATKFYSDGLSVGEHRMFVVAVDGNGEVSGPTLQASIQVSDEFVYGTHGRSVLVSDEPTARDNADARSSGSSPIPQNPRGSETSANDVRWEWNAVSGASEYEVTVDGQYAGKTGGTSWTSTDLWTGTHSMTVKSIISDSYSAQSETAKVQVTGQADNNATTDSSNDSRSTGDIGVVQGLRAEELADSDVQWSWSSQSGAVEYEVTVDGAVAGTTGSTQFVSRDLWRGTHSLTVKAIDSSGNKSDQSDTLKIQVTGSGSGSVEGSSGDVEEVIQVVAPPPPQSGGGDENAANVENLIDPASYDYSEVSNKAGYELVFSDEFNGTALNPFRWHSQLRWDGEWNGERYEYRVINGEDQFYVNVLGPDEEHQSDVVPVYNPFQFDGNRLAIRAKINPLKDRPKNRTHGSLDEIVHQQQFLSGAISTHEKFSRKYGYFEARIKIPSHDGTFPAFWLFHARRAYEGTQRTEIDIMENLGHAPHYIYNSFHYFTNVSENYGGDANFIKPRPSGQVFNGTDFSRDYHVYAVEWSPGNVKWFIDGELVSELDNGQVDYEELYLMINLAMGGNWTNFPTSAGGLGRPSGERYPTSNDVNNFSDPALEIDYVRVYKRR